MRTNKTSAKRTWRLNSLSKKTATSVCVWTISRRPLRLTSKLLAHWWIQLKIRNSKRLSNCSNKKSNSRWLYLSHSSKKSRLLMLRSWLETRSRMSILAEKMRLKDNMRDRLLNWRIRLRGRSTNFNSLRKDLKSMSTFCRRLRSTTTT